MVKLPPVTAAAERTGSALFWYRGCSSIPIRSSEMLFSSRSALNRRAYKSFSSRSSFNATFDRDLIRGFNSFQAGLQIRFNKVRSTTNTRIPDNSRSVTQTLSGSVGYDDNFHRFVLSERNMVGSSAGRASGRAERKDAV